MDDPEMVKKKIAQVNDIFSKAGTLESGKMRQMSWDVGIMERDYYVTGGHMARTIDQKLGREAVAETIAQGPRSFIDIYNKLVPKEEQILCFKGPDPDSPLLRLKAAALSNDNVAISKLQKELEALFAGNTQNLEYSLNSLGYKILLAFENPEAAIKVFTVGLNILPRAANLWDSKGEDYFENNDYKNSEKCYRKALELNPSMSSASKMLEKIA